MSKYHREDIYNKFKGKCAYTGRELEKDWQVDHITPKYRYKWGIVGGESDNETNLIPTVRIVNHYKRGLDLEQFRKYMLNFHLRFKKLPKNTTVKSTIKRKEYMNTIASLFDITIDKPFSGIFYFETL